MQSACHGSASQVIHGHRAGASPELLLSRLHEVGVECASHSQSNCHACLEVLCHLLDCLQAPASAGFGNCDEVMMKSHLKLNDSLLAKFARVTKSSRVEVLCGSIGWGAAAGGQGRE